MAATWLDRQAAGREQNKDEEVKSRHHRDWNFHLLRNLGEVVQKMAA
jgi:hypothetical protein